MQDTVNNLSFINDVFCSFVQHNTRNKKKKRINEKKTFDLASSPIALQNHFEHQHTNECVIQHSAGHFTWAAK